MYVRAITDIGVFLIASNIRHLSTENKTFSFLQPLFTAYWDTFLNILYKVWPDT